MTAPSAWAVRARTLTLTPALPQADDAVGRPEHDGEEAEPDQQAEAVAVEPEPDQEVECEGAQQHEDQRADEGADRAGDASDHGDDQHVDAGPDADRARRDLPVVPDLEHAGERGDEGRKGIGGDAM